MKRRCFLKTSFTSGITVATFPAIIVKSPVQNKLKRIGLTTVVFRDRFKPSDDNPALTLKDIPSYFADRFRIHNVELWSRHFESKSPSYLSGINKSLQKNKSKLVNIQVDTKHDISDPNEEVRMKGIMEMKEWIDVGAEMNTNYIRMSAMKKSYDMAVKSVREINAYAKRKGIMTLVENHMDLFSNVENHLNIQKDIVDENFGLLADFGNYPGSFVQYKALERIAPHTRLISAKTKDFNESMEHISYDFAKCVDIFEEKKYSGIYSLEQWGKPDPAYDYERITDWMIDQVKDRI